MLFILFAASAFRKLSSIYVFSYFPFGFEGRIWDLIVSVPDHCLSFYFPYFMCANSEGSGETAQMRRLAWAFAGRLCDKYHNPMSWLKTRFPLLALSRGARWLSGRVSDSGARGPGFETYRRRVVSLSKTLYSPKVLVNYPGSDGSVPTWLKNCWLGR